MNTTSKSDSPTAPTWGSFVQAASPMLKTLADKLLSVDKSKSVPDQLKKAGITTELSGLRALADTARQEAQAPSELMDAKVAANPRFLAWKINIRKAFADLAGFTDSLRDQVSYNQRISTIDLRKHRAELQIFIDIFTSYAGTRDSSKYPLTPRDRKILIYMFDKKVNILSPSSQLEILQGMTGGYRQTKGVFTNLNNCGHVGTGKGKGTWLTPLGETAARSLKQDSP